MFHKSESSRQCFTLTNATLWSISQFTTVYAELTSLQRGHPQSLPCWNTFLLILLKMALWYEPINRFSDAQNFSIDFKAAHVDFLTCPWWANKNKLWLMKSSGIWKESCRGVKGTRNMLHNTHLHTCNYQVTTWTLFKRNVSTSTVPANGSRNSFSFLFSMSTRVSNINVA